jgi:arsenate reductase-like glutaredoxin family protein
VLALKPGLADRNYARQPLIEAELRDIVAAAGGVAAVLNTRHAVAKERGWKIAPPDVDTYVRAVLEDSNLLRRPILLVGGEAVVGTDPDAWSRLLGG